ncbi:selection and upkeep of intraepithelial T-cells protein 1 isoform X3 [Oreochromis niloticus]|uniref:selection and upkeep of intraepithelial T-cells protein 1 isoform X3 n=1 Tax=Oreochromis niloticus TaxID=8128 RepID=UPI000DF13F7B|nr:selection and upkeep of intraepithelial T-cells protein 1 isoform X3 [Oreochromis niloticus]
MFHNEIEAEAQPTSDLMNYSTDSVFCAPCLCTAHFATLWTFILWSAFSVWTLVGGEVVVIGSNLPIIAAPGDDVILSCHLEPMFDVQGLTVEWSKPDLKPDPSDRLSRVEYVHLYRDRKEVPDMKMASYFRRTELFMDAMKHGNISLKILNVSEEDNGRYRCFIPKLRSRVKAAVVELVVDPNHIKTSVAETSLQTQDPQDKTPRNGSLWSSLSSPSCPLWLTLLSLHNSISGFFRH